MENWYTLDIPAILDQLRTDPEQGLSDEEAKRRLEETGLNELIDRGVKNPWKILWEQLTGIMVVILIVSAVISLALHETIDAIAILVIVVLNAVLGFTQEYRAEQAMAALKKMAVPHVRVKRGGHVKDISATTLVPGDIVLLEAGNAIPADLRLVESANLRAQEAVLTGESEPVEKNPAVLSAADLPIGDRRNSLFMGTVITYGRGLAVVTETGMNTQLGNIAEMLQSVESEQTPLQRRLEQLGKGLALAALVIVAVVFILGVLRGEPIRLMFLTAISMAVAAIPEGLPAVVTIALALGAQRMLTRQALIRKLPAVETLGSVTVICSDKTGTLTENKMTVTVLDVAGNRLDLNEHLRDFSPTIQAKDARTPALLDHPGVSILLTGGALCNDALLEPDDENGGFTTVGDPTEGALIIAAAQAGLWKAALETSLPRVGELPFDSERKRMTTIHSLDDGLSNTGLDILYPSRSGKYLAFTKGSIDGLLEISRQVWVDDHVEDITPAWKQRIQAANDQMAQNGMRVLGVAYRWLEDSKPDSQPLEQDLIIVGLVGMIDPARPEVKAAISTTRSAGIRPIMITGDHPLTALHIAQDLGITTDRKVMTGQELARITVEELEEVVNDISVYARVSPEHKLKIVQALQDKGQIVAMTGDGVNDAPALKKADIGIAMGITGTDVSKEAADMVLLNDNYATIVAAVEEGRRIYDNIRKFVKYALTSNVGEIWVMLLATFLGMPLPLLPLQILWVNLVTDGLPGLALTIEPAERNAMQRPPISPKESIFGRGLARDILWIGLLVGLTSLGIGLWAWRVDNPAWQTMIFTTLTLSQMGNVLATRSEKESLFKIGVFSNRPLLGAVLLTVVLQFAVIYLPPLQTIFNTVALTFADLLISLIASAGVFFGIELFKWFLRRKSL